MFHLQKRQHGGSPNAKLEKLTVRDRPARQSSPSGAGLVLGEGDYSALRQIALGVRLFVASDHHQHRRHIIAAAAAGGRRLCAGQGYRYGAPVLSANSSKLQNICNRRTTALPQSGKGNEQRALGCRPSYSECLSHTVSAPCCH